MQPQQQTVVTSAGHAQPVYISQPYQTASVVNTYSHRQSTVIGILLIICGCLSIIFNIVDLAIGIKDETEITYDYSRSEHTVSRESNGVVGHGFWCGVLIIIAGGFGIGAARHETRCMINTFMVFAIIGAVFAVIQLIVAADGASTLYESYENYLSGSRRCRSTFCRDLQAVYAMEILLALFGVVEFGLCLWGLILWCVTGGYCAPTPTIVVAMPAGQPQVTVVSQQQQQQQPVAVAQPQTYPPQQVVYPSHSQYSQPQSYPPQQVLYQPQYPQRQTYPPQRRLSL